jgi:hypothetical protein
VPSGEALRESIAARIGHDNCDASGVRAAAVRRRAERAPIAERSE